MLAQGKYGLELDINGETRFVQLFPFGSEHNFTYKNGVLALRQVDYYLNMGVIAYDVQTSTWFDVLDTSGVVQPARNISFDGDQYVIRLRDGRILLGKPGDFDEIFQDSDNGYFQLDVAIDQGQVAISNGYFRYLDGYADGRVFDILSAGAQLDGREVEYIFISEEAISGNEVAMQVEFTDGTQGIYIATIPEPANLGLLALGGLMLIRRKH